MSDLAKTLARLAAILGPPDGDAVALDGGIINRNFKVDFDGKPYVIRIPRTRSSSASTATPSGRRRARRRGRASGRRCGRCWRTLPYS